MACLHDPQFILFDLERVGQGLDLVGLGGAEEIALIALDFDRLLKLLDVLSLH